MLYRIFKFTYNLVRLVVELAVLSLVVAYWAQYFTVKWPLLMHWCVIYGVALITLSPLLLTHAHEMVELELGGDGESSGFLSIVMLVMVTIGLIAAIGFKFYA